VWTPILPPRASLTRWGAHCSSLLQQESYYTSVDLGIASSYSSLPHYEP
jgi:hypothetical protein